MKKIIKEADAKRHLIMTLMMGISFLQKRDRGLATFFVKSMLQVMDDEDEILNKRLVNEMDRLEIKL
jgi:hypothetical protein